MVDKNTPKAPDERPTQANPDNVDKPDNEDDTFIVHREQRFDEKGNPTLHETRVKTEDYAEKARKEGW